MDVLSRALLAKGVELYSTGGTATYLSKTLGAKVTAIEAVTEFPEMMDGRVKTLHPRVFGGVLARRDQPSDLEAAERHGIPLFDLVVVNLYPFWDHLGETVDQQVPFIDIGGPSMLRAAAKNSAAVTVLSSPEDYASFLAEWEGHDGATTRAFRHSQAAKTFGRTSAYDASIAAQWAKAIPETIPTSLSLAPQQPLRYGENPHQKAAWCGVAEWKTLQGKELSYNNLLDAEAAVRLANEFPEGGLAIIKHNNPCGVAAGRDSVASLYARALATDDKSAFGGIVATNRTIDADAAKAMSEIFLEVVFAPAFTAEAQAIFAKKKNLRLIAWEKPNFSPWEVRAALGGWLIQSADNSGLPETLHTATKNPLPEAARADVRFAWLVAKHVRSNAIVIAHEGATVGIGAGQMSRVDAVEIALKKCGARATRGAVLASDAFFPFRDNIDLLRDSGLAAIIQPGGSVRDAEVVEACEALGITMVFTGERHFRH